jgi:quercetin dioxygenase-like cupin family protein
LAYQLLSEQKERVVELTHYFLNKDAPLEDLGGGIKRKILAYHESLMVVEVHFEAGAVGAVHSHPHEQITYILDGEFEFNIDGDKQVLTAGDTTFKEANIPHGAVCLKAGRLLDIFTPYREDFVQKKES